MPHFTYTARNSEGMLVRGTITALSAQAARDSLKEMSLQAEELYEVPDTPIQKTVPASVPAAPSAAPSALPKASSWKVTEREEAPAPVPIAEKIKPEVKYFPLLDTLRLYAGWLLYWYFLIFAFGSYDFTRELPFEIPLVSGLFQSPVIISFALGAFLFLMLTSLHRVLHRGIGTGLALTAVWFIAMGMYRMNM